MPDFSLTHLLNFYGNKNHLFVDHIEYIKDSIGEDHVRLGSDFDGFPGYVSEK